MCVVFLSYPLWQLSCLCWWLGSGRTWNCYVKLLETCKWTLSLTNLYWMRHWQLFIIRWCVQGQGVCTDCAWLPCMLVKNMLACSYSWLWPSNLLQGFADERTIHMGTCFWFVQCRQHNFRLWTSSAMKVMLCHASACSVVILPWLLCCSLGTGRNIPSQVYMHCASAGGQHVQGAAVLQ